MASDGVFEIIKQADFALEQWIEYYRLNVAILQESYPYRDILSETQFLREPRPLFMQNAGLRCLVLCHRGRMVALSHYRSVPEKSVCIAEVKFLKNSFNADIARFMAQGLRDIAQEHGLNVLQMIAEHHCIVQHYISTGRFEKVGQVRESVLDLSRLDHGLIMSWAGTHAEFTLRPMSWNDSASLDALVQIYNETAADVPFQNAVGMFQPRDPSFFLDWVTRMERNDLQLLSFGLFCQDQLAGLALFDARAKDPKTALIGYTGIGRAFRKKGLGKQLKALSTLALMNLHPSLKFIVTANEETNVPMLKINRAMGFEPRAEFTMLRYSEGHPETL